MFINANPAQQLADKDRKVSVTKEVEQTPEVSLELQRAVEQFLYLEASCMDEHRYDEWLALCAEEVLYWIPCNDDDIDPKRNVSIIYDRRPQIEDRVFRLKGRHAFAQQPRTRLLRVVSNVVITGATADTVTATSHFTLGDLRPAQEVHWYGKNRHVLNRAGNNFRIREKKVLLLNNDYPMGNMTFLM